MSFLTIEPDTQYSWHESRTPFKSSRSGIGNGEELLVEMVGGELMGYTASWDFTDPLGRRWEVKEPVGGTIRLCTSGRESSGHVVSAIGQIVNQLLVAHTSCGNDLALLLAGLIGFDFDIFMRDDVPRLLRGEIPIKRFGKLVDIVRAISKHANNPARFHCVSLDGIPKKVDAVTYARIVDLIGADDVYIDVQSGILARLSHPAFKDPDILTHAWNSVTASRVFPDVDGVILVSQAGFYPIFRDRLNELLVFDRISQMVPKFKYTGRELVY